MKLILCQYTTNFPSECFREKNGKEGLTEFLKDKLCFSLLDLISFAGKTPLLAFIMHCHI